MPARTAITLSTKIEILDKPGASLKVIADKFKIGKTTVADIKKQKQSLLADFNNPNLNNADRKRKREGKHGHPYLEPPLRLMRAIRETESR